MSGTRGATAAGSIDGFLRLRRGHNSNCRDVSEPLHEERRELREAGLGAPSGEAPPPRSPPERHPHRRRQVLAVDRRFHGRTGVRRRRKSGFLERLPAARDRAGPPSGWRGVFTLVTRHGLGSPDFVRAGRREREE